MDFEFDPDKSTANLRKHGVSFAVARALWDDPDRLAVPARTDDEPRHALIATLRGRVWIAIFTWREGRVRIISVRRARPLERRLYREGS